MATPISQNTTTPSVDSNGSTSVNHLMCLGTDACADGTSTMETETLSKLFVTPFGFKASYFAVGGFGMLGNLMVLVVIFYSPSLRKTSTNKFIANQSSIDFFASFFILLMNTLRDSSPEVLGDGTAQELWCRLWMTKWPLFGTFMSSTLNLVAMTYERYYAIVYPLHHSHSFTSKKAYYIMGLAWFCGLGWHASYAVSTTTRIDGVCKTVYSSDLIRRSVAVVIIIVQYVAPILSITVAYVGIFLTLRTSSDGPKISSIHDIREERMKKARKNVIKTLAKVFVCFVCCWTPNQIFFIGWNFGYDFTPDATFYHSTVLILFINSVINPLVYTLTYEQFQQVQMRFFCPCVERGSSSSKDGKLGSVSTVDQTGTTMAETCAP